MNQRDKAAEESQRHYEEYRYSHGLMSDDEMNEYDIKSQQEWMKEDPQGFEEYMNQRNEAEAASQRHYEEYRYSHGLMSDDEMNNLRLIIDVKLFLITTTSQLRVVHSNIQTIGLLPEIYKVNH